MIDHNTTQGAASITQSGSSPIWPASNRARKTPATTPANMNNAYQRTSRPKTENATGSDGDGITKPEEAVSGLSPLLPPEFHCRTRNSSSCARFGSPSHAPGRVVANAPAAAAYRTSSADRGAQSDARDRAMIAAVNASPAPVGSTASTRNAGTNATDEPELNQQPRSPSVSTTALGPSPRIVSIAASGVTCGP